MDRKSSNLKFAAESAHLVKGMVEKHHLRKDPGFDPPVCVDWVARKDFTVEVGHSQINAHIQTWGLQPCWIHSLDFLCTTKEEEEEDEGTFYHYRAEFNTTTSQRMVSSRASVYFAVGIWKSMPDTETVEIQFVVEGSRLLHTPGIRFREKWLADVIEYKTMLRKTVDF